MTKQSPAISLLGLPYDANSSHLKGPADAPDAIRAAFRSPHSNTASELGVELTEGLVWYDAGNLDIETLEPEVSNSVTTKEAEKLYSGGQKVIALGGDHSVTYPLVKAAHAIHGPVDILHIDAHPDLYDDFDSNPFSHASPFARIMENGLANRLVQIGIRTMNDHQRQQAKRFDVEVIEMKDWNNIPRFNFEGPLYLSIDIDGIDPAYAPGVSHNEPGGLSSRDVISVIQRFSGNLIGADVVELNPTQDINDMTAMLAAKLVKEIMGRMAKA